MKFTKFRSSQVLILVAIVGCKSISEDSATVTEYYPSKAYFEGGDKLLKFDLNNPELNFRDITNSISDAFYDNNTELYVQIDSKSAIRKIVIFENSHSGPEKNYFTITEDSILNTPEAEYSIKDLGRMMKTYYENNGKIPRYPDSPEDTYFEISLDTASKGPAIEKSLNHVIDVFKEVNAQVKDSLELVIAFSYFRQIPPPPPPPE